MREIKVLLPDWAIDYFADGWKVAKEIDVKVMNRNKIRTFEDYVSWGICELIKTDLDGLGLKELIVKGTGKSKDRP